MVARPRETQTADVQGYSHTAWRLRNLNTMDNKYLYQYWGKITVERTHQHTKNWHTAKRIKNIYTPETVGGGGNDASVEDGLSVNSGASVERAETVTSLGVTAGASELLVSTA